MASGVVIDVPTRRPHPKSKRQLAKVQDLPRILLADDEKEILRAVNSLIGDKYNIVGTAENGERALDLVRVGSPDIVVLDIFMPRLNGFETAIQLKESGSAAKVLFLTVHEDPDFVDAAISVGALGYVLKGYLVTDLLPAIRQVLSGNLYVSPSLLPC